MNALELSCSGIVLLSLGLRFWWSEQRGGLLVRVLTIILASWLTENSCIRLYGFYSYSAKWSLFVDQVPVMVPLIWPVVLISIGDLASPLFAKRRAPIVGLMVFVDACFIEVLSVACGLWVWAVPGFFGVPLIGVAGWGLFAAIVTAFMGCRDDLQSGLRYALVVLGGPLLCHGALLGLWWGLLRWTNGAWPTELSVALALGVNVAISALVFQLDDIPALPLKVILLRIPAAAFFFSLLAFNGVVEPELWVFGLAFSAPYLLAMVRILWNSGESVEACEEAGAI